MAVEKSVFLNKENIVNFVKKHYNLETINVCKIDKGSANCYKIISDKGIFFLKEFQSHFNSQMLEREINVCNIVRNAGVATSEFIINVNGDFVSIIGNHCFHMQKYIEGHTFERNAFDDDLLLQSAELLGKINNCLEQIDFLPDGFSDNWFYGFSVDKSIEKHQMVRDMIATSNLSDDWKEKIFDACDIKIKMLMEYKDDFLKYRRLTKVNSHGDYNNLQILCEKKLPQIKAIIDFSSSAYVFASWEIIRSYSYGAKECISGRDINMEKLKSYINKYLSQYNLSLFDVSNMAGFYYFNLLRSSYGFNSNNKKVLEFALWRTTLCKYLRDFYKDIDMYLYKEYKGYLR